MNEEKIKKLSTIAKAVAYTVNEETGADYQTEYNSVFAHLVASDILKTIKSGSNLEDSLQQIRAEYTKEESHNREEINRLTEVLTRPKPKY